MKMNSYHERWVIKNNYLNNSFQLFLTKIFEMIVQIKLEKEPKIWTTENFLTRATLIVFLVICRLEQWKKRNWTCQFKRPSSAKEPRQLQWFQRSETSIEAMLLDQIGVVLGEDGAVVRDEPRQLTGQSGDFGAEEWKSGRNLCRPRYIAADHLLQEFGDARVYECQHQIIKKYASLVD